MVGADAVIIGGGFFGCHIALALKDLGFGRVCLIEREPGLMRRASFVNQARVHSGYHYPRSLPTAISSRRSFSRFVQEYSFAVVPQVSMIYGIARNSRVSPSQFARFCEEIGAPCHENRRLLESMFDSALMEACFNVEEIAFNTSQIAEHLAMRLEQAKVDCRFGSEAQVEGWNDRSVRVRTPDGSLEASYVFNCTYAHLDDVGVRIRNSIKKELAEIALINPPDQLQGRAVTVMDGPFFSSMPFPALGCYSLTHVRYTPHTSWTEPGERPLTPAASRYEVMVRDAARYMPCMQHAQYQGSLYELKAILMKSEGSDSRPIVFEQSLDSERVYSILGSKIDNVYDILEILGRQQWLTR
jgi:glycine/D-amino acid oxidase-like deaminating enzyme